MLTHTVTNLNNGYVSLNIELPSGMVQPILQAFSSMCDLARSATSKTKTVTVSDRQPEQKARNEENYRIYRKTICDKFNELYEIHNDVKLALSKVNMELKPIFPNTCYDSVKSILTQEGMLKNKKYNIPKK